MAIFKKLASAAVFFLISLPSFAQDTSCIVDDDVTDQVLTQVELKNPNAIRGLRNCFKFDHKLMLRAIIIDPTQFQYAADVLQNDENFVRRILKVNPDALQYASPKLRSNPIFMEDATYISRDSLQYAAPVLSDNKLFMRRMIKIDSRNYKFASMRLRELPEFASEAFEDDGMLLEFAPQKIKEDRVLVKIAFKSNNNSIKFATTELQQDPEFHLPPEKLSSVNIADLEQSISDNYLVREKQKNLGFSVTGKAKKFSKQKIIDRNYVTKWRGNLHLIDENISQELHLTSASSRNYQIPWKKDFRKYPELITKIEKFFTEHHVDQSAIDQLLTTYLWKIKSRPETLAFNLYLLRDSNDIDFGPEFAAVTSLTAVVQKRGKKWEMTVIEVIFDSEVKTSVSYPQGHKKAVLWDLYKNNKNDKNPKIIFKVEDRFREYFEIFEEENGGKYKMVHRFEPLISQEKSN